jgi:hypothetical protein
MFASVIAGPALPGAVAQESVADSRSATGPAEGDERWSAAAGQHVADVQPELPEFLGQAPMAPDVREPAGGPIAARLVQLPAPLLDAPQRPPRLPRWFA